MRLREFEELAFDYWERIPEQYREGIDGVRVLRRAKPHESHVDVYTMGECVTEAYPSDYGGPDTIRSAVVIYWGSFRELAALDPDFDWEGELWETLTHELRHHLESLAAEDALEDVDYAADENFKRHEGVRFDPLFHQRGERVDDAEAPRLVDDGGQPIASVTWRVEGDWFVESTHGPDAAPVGPHALEWSGAVHRFVLPPADADVTFARLADGFQPAPVPGLPVDDVVLVLVRRRSAWRATLDFVRGRRPHVAQIDLAVQSEETR